MPDLIHNVAVLLGGVLGVFVFYSLTETYLPEADRPNLNRLAKVVLFAFAGLYTMYWPIEIIDGVIGDARSAVLVGATLFGGWAAGLASAVAMIALRWGLGGSGAIAGVVGIGVEYLVLLALISPLSARWLPRHSLHLIFVAASAVAILEALSLLLITPLDLGLELFRANGFALGMLQFTAAMALGLLLKFVHDRTEMLNEMRSRQDELRKNVVAAGEMRKDLLRAQQLGRIGSWKLELETGALEWSPETYRIFGRDPSEPVMLEDFLDAVHPDDRARVQAAWEAALQGEPYEIEHRLVKDGTVVWVRPRAEFSGGPPSRVRVAFGTVQDITEEVQRGEQERFDRDFRALVARISTELITATDDERFDATIDRALAGLGSLFGVDRAYLFQFSDDLGTMRNSHEWCATGIPPFQNESQTIRTRDLGWWFSRMLEMRTLQIEDVTAMPSEAAREKSLFESQSIQSLISLPLRAEVKPLIGFIGFDSVREKRRWSQSQVDMLQVIADTVSGALVRREKTRALSESEAMYHQLAIASRSVRWSSDRDGRLTFVDPLIEVVLGYRPDDLVDKRIVFDLMPPEDRDSTREQFQEVLATGDALHGQEAAMLANDGSVRWVLSTVLPLQDHSGSIIGLRGSVTDISERKATELELEKYRDHLEDLVAKRTQDLEAAQIRAEAANEAKSAFLANMSHEIRTPLNAIIGFAYLLKQDLIEPDQTEKIRKLIASAKHLLGIINDILDLAKIEADRITLESAPFNIRSLVEHACSNILDRVTEKNLQLHREIDPRLDHVTVIGDSLRLRQILINFLSNAAKFTERGQIVARVRLLSERDDRLCLRFEVEDTGIGLSEKQMMRVFMPFEQGESSISRKYGGTGLGLVISRRLARLMGGDTGVDSALGQGSTFWAEIRVKKTDMPIPDETVIPNTGPDMPRRGARVLLAEDNPLNQEVARTLLESAGLAVTVANNGQEAVDRVEQGDFDLVLMDVQMPEMDGLAATRRIRAMPKAAGLPILAMTANAFEEDRKSCEDAGMVGFLTKPVDPEWLYRTLAHWLPKNGKPLPTPASEPDRSR